MEQTIGEEAQVSDAGAVREDSDDVRRRLMFAFLVLSVAVRIVFWTMTDRVWEDALITVRHAENAVQGAGLTHHPAQGGPVHGYTSAISVLIPLVGELVIPGSGIAVLKFSSLLAAALTIWLGYRIAIHPAVNLSPVATAFFLGYLALEFHQILYGMAGMETQWIVVLTLLGLWLFLQRRTALLGVACGLALWGRPDGVILILAVLVALIWQRQWRAIPVILLIAALTFAPWVAFTEAYYGSVVPNTVVAKKVAFVRTFDDAPTWGGWIGQWSAELVHRAKNLRLWLSPVYGGCGTAVNFIRGARPLQALYFVVLCAGLVRLVWRRDARVIAVFAGGFAAYAWIMLPTPAYWYLMPWLGVVALLFAVGVDGIRGQGHRPLRRFAAGTLALGYLAVYAFALTRAFPAERHVQLGVEDACRTQTGKWLDRHAGPDDWVGCECLGYLGYYAHRPMLDFPGLSSPRSVRALQTLPEGKRNLIALMNLERPEWMALRPAELEQLQREYPATAAMYVEATRIQADPEHVRKLGEWLWLDGKATTVDEEFIILRRHDVRDASSPTAS